MNKLIKSDIRRILTKEILYIFTVILWISAIFTKNGKTPGQQIDAMEGLIDTFGIILISIPVLLCVYGDEFKAGSMQIAIGRGVSRTKIIFAKFLDCVILSLVAALLLSGVIYIKNIATGLAISDKQNTMLFVYILLTVVKACGYYAIAAFFMMMNFSIASGMITAVSRSAPCCCVAAPLRLPSPPCASPTSMAPTGCRRNPSPALLRNCPS